MNTRILFSFFVLMMLSVVSVQAQIDSLYFNGSDTTSTMVSGDAIGWQFKVPNGATTEASIWFDVNSNGVIDSSSDVRRYQFTTTDGPSTDGIPDLDGIVNGRVEFSIRLGFAPGNYIYIFSQGGVSLSRISIVNPLASPAHSVTGHITAPSGKSPANLFVEAKRSGNDAQPKSWEGITDSLGFYVIQIDGDTTGNPWEVRFIDGNNPFPSHVFSPAVYYITMTGNPSGLDFTFQSSIAKIVGYLKDENGNPITNRGVSILAMSNSNSLYRSSLTNDFGYFEIGLTQTDLWDGDFRLASYYTMNTDEDMIGIATIHGIHYGDSLFYNLVAYHVNSSIQGRVLVNGNPPGFPIEIAGSVSDTGYSFTISDSLTGNFSLPVSNRLYNYEIGPDRLVGQYTWTNVFAHPGQTGIVINLTPNFVSNKYWLNLNANNGTITRNPDQSLYDSGMVVQLTADADDYYRFAGWGGDASGNANPITIMMNSNKTITALFEINPNYLVRYRAFNPDSIALELDNLGKIGKSVKKKPTSAQFSILIDSRVSGANGLHLEFGSAIDTNYEFYTVPPSTRVEVAKSRLAKWNLTFASPLALGDTVRIYGHSSKGVFQKVGSYWWMNNGVLAGTKLRNPTFTMNVLRLPMPNRINVMEEIYPDGYPYGMNIGIMQTNRDSAKRYGWVNLKSSNDVLKSLRVITKGVISLHDSVARGFDSIAAGKIRKIFVGKQTSLPPTKQDNILFANLVALKLSILASAMERTPVGFGELVLNDSLPNPWNGFTLAEISTKADTMMRGYPGRTFETALTYDTLSMAVRNILDGFEGVVDTTSWGNRLALKGTRTLLDYRILEPNTSIPPYRIVQGGVQSGEPERFMLYQNYPNPFNPTTVISYSLSVNSVVTVKVYNMLGQEIATILKNEEIEAGNHEVIFDASAFSSGVYFYRLTATNVEDGSVFSDVKRMILIK